MMAFKKFSDPMGAFIQKDGCERKPSLWITCKRLCEAYRDYATRIGTNVEGEVHHLHISKAERYGAARFDPNARSHATIPLDATPERLRSANRNRIMEYLNEKPFQGNYPNIVCFISDLRSREEECDDLEELTALAALSPKVNALAVWKNHKITCYFENPRAEKPLSMSSKLQAFFS